MSATGWQQRPSPSQGKRPGNWQTIRKAQLAREPLCRMCARRDRVTAATEVDHVIPIHKGGTHDAANLQAICAPCHSRKTADEALEARGFKTKPIIGSDGWPIA